MYTLKIKLNYTPNMIPLYGWYWAVYDPIWSPNSLLYEENPFVLELSFGYRFQLSSAGLRCSYYLN
jgi:hypothetical protein